MTTPTIELHTWKTPNGRKPAILLAELEAPYHLHLVDIGTGVQKSADFLALNPNGKIPALVDRDPALGAVVVFESGAILQYLAEKYGRFFPPGGAKRAETLAWLFWQVGGAGPFFGQLGRFAREEPRNEAAFAHFWQEAKRLVMVLEGQLAVREYVTDTYSIADIALYPWFASMAETQPQLLEDCPGIQAWLARVGARPAVAAGMQLSVPVV